MKTPTSNFKPLKALAFAGLCLFSLLACDRKASFRAGEGKSSQYDHVMTEAPLPRPGIGDGTTADSAKAEFNTESYDRIIENAFVSPRSEPLSTFSIDVDGAAYSNVRRFLTSGTLPPPDAARTEEMINYFRYEYTQPLDGHPFAIHTQLTECPWNPGHQLVHIALKGVEIPMGNLPPSNLVFLVDVSGSMESDDKLGLLKRSFGQLVETLRPQDKVSIVVYAGSAGMVLPPTPGSDKRKILEALDKLQAGGSTAGGEGINLAYKVAQENFIQGGNNRVILATDGDFNVGVSSEGDLERLIEQKREAGVFLTVMGFGTGNYQDSKMQILADKGNGNHYYIDSDMEGKKVLVNEFGGTLFTIAKDVKLQVEFNPARVKGYRLIGYENRMLAAEDFDDDKKDAGELGSGHTVTALYEVIPAGSAEEVKTPAELRYQNSDINPAAFASDELMTVKFRYKAPEGTESKLIVKHLSDKPVAFAQASENLRWAAAVTEFSLLLRDSDYKAQGSYAQCLQIAEAAKGTDKEGYRAEFIQLVETAQRLSLKEQTARGK